MELLEEFITRELEEGDLKTALELFYSRGMLIDAYIHKYNLTEEEATERVNTEYPLDESTQEFLDKWREEAAIYLSQKEAKDAVRH